MRFVVAVCICLVVSLIHPSIALAQTIQTETYGTLAKSWLILSARDFQPTSSTTVYTSTDSATIYHIDGPPTFDAALHLPTGAIITEIQYQLCDTNNASDIAAAIWSKSSDGTFAYIDQGAVANANSGCGLFTKTYTPPIQIDNDANMYGIEVFMFATDNTNQLIGARVGYKLQISPDSSTATFTDVPVGHPFHRFVEALYASGITGGCGGGNYCPDAPITRGQMAVFLAGALGLHWAP